MEGEKRKMLDSVRENNPSFKGLNAILRAMDKVDRKYFIHGHDLHRVYADYPLAIGHDQTISQPSTVARMILLSKIKKGMNILEVGAGSGWNASLMGYLTYPGKVIAVERIPELEEFAVRNFNRLKIKGWVKEVNVEFLKGSVFSKKELMKERFDLIVVTASTDPNLSEKLKRFNFKRLIFPNDMGYLEVWEKEGKKIELKHREGRYAFVPLME